METGGDGTAWRKTVWRGLPRDCSRTGEKKEKIMKSGTGFGKLLFGGALAVIVIGAMSLRASAYPVVSTGMSWAITPPPSVPGVIEFTGPQGNFASQEKQLAGRANTGLSGPTIYPPPTFFFGSMYGMSIGYSGGSAGGATAGSMSTLIQGAAGLYIRNLSDSNQAVTLSGTYSTSIVTSDASPGTGLAPTGVGRGEVGISITIDGQNYFNVDRFVNTLGVNDAVNNQPWQFTFDLAAHTDALMDAQIFAAAKAISLEGSTPPLITDSLAPGVTLANPVPEPATLAILALGGVALVRRRR
jgi:hypothetical protein